MTAIKYMSLLTTFSVFAALISIVWQAFLSLKQLNKVTVILTGLLAIESSLKPIIQTNQELPKVALGYGACTDLLVHGPSFLNFSEEILGSIGPEFVMDEINSEEELLKAFAYYFKSGAAAERFMSDTKLFRKILQIAKYQYSKDIQWVVGGNAPLMGMRLHMEGARVLLGARMSHKLRRLIPGDIAIAGDQIPDDDIHIIFEYKSGDQWGPLTAPRANRFILHNDQNNPHLNSLEKFGEALKEFEPNLLVISGLQMMDNYKFEKDVRESRLRMVERQLKEQDVETLKHFEMASYVEIELLQLLRKYVLPNVDSVGLNEQELHNLLNLLKYGNASLAADCNPRVATTLDQMREVFQILITEDSVGDKRTLSRIHLHTLAFQAMLTLKESKWNNTKAAVSKAALTAHRYVCQSNDINPSSAMLVMDDSFAISRGHKAERIRIDPQNPVNCWDEELPGGQIKIELCVAPVLVCRVAKKTAGAGDNISAAALSQQL